MAKVSIEYKPGVLISTDEMVALYDWLNSQLPRDKWSWKWRATPGATIGMPEGIDITFDEPNIALLFVLTFGK